jgi:hypothetical protein
MSGLIHSGDYGVLQRRAGRNTPRPSGQTTLADKISRFEECDIKIVRPGQSIELNGDDLRPTVSEGHGIESALIAALKTASRT